VRSAIVPDFPSRMSSSSYSRCWVMVFCDLARTKMYLPERFNAVV
jgi:hypothetical protein